MIFHYTSQVKKKKKKKKTRIEKRNRDNKKLVSKSNIWDILGKKSLRERKQRFTKPMGRKKSLTGRKFASSTRKREESRQR